ncbi:hypothetical protein CL634_06990 [bacterium]|nr:hypothetical protein [bacterium]
MDLDDIKRKLDSLSAQKQLLESQMKAENKMLRGIKKELVDEKKAHSIATSVGEEIQGEFGKQLSDMVTSCLQSVFIDDVYEFGVKFETKRNSTSVNFSLSKNGSEQQLLEGSGGGVISVVCAGLRIAMHSIKSPRANNTLVMDEPFSALRGIDNVKRLYSMLDTFCQKLNVQLIVISSANENSDLTEDYNVISIENSDGISRVV